MATRRFIAYIPISIIPTSIIIPDKVWQRVKWGTNSTVINKNTK